ncbi:MAG: single-stranded DNA-binding protein [Coriobacteriales bacterium]|jgi:single-strand DNA-binding protein|nr:single-stranded DNA-binding protein [Coriobacteriales bacterium]
MSINRVVISGNLTRDPELRQTSTGMPVLGIGVAVNDRRKNASTGEWEDFPNFIDCTMFGTRAESVSRFLSKGAKVAIEGKLRWSQWERDGQKRSKIEVIIDEIEFLPTSRDGNAGGGGGGGAGSYNAAPTPAVTAGAEAEIPAAPDISIYEDGDIPF